MQAPYPRTPYPCYPHTCTPIFPYQDKGPIEKEVDDSGTTALHFAAEHGTWHTKDEEGKLVLHFESEHGTWRGDVPCHVEALLKLKADANVTWPGPSSSISHSTSLSPSLSPSTSIWL